MFILIFFLVVAVSQFIVNKMLCISDENEDSYAYSKKDSLVLAILFLIGIVLQIISPRIEILRTVYWWACGIYFMAAIIIMLIFMSVKKARIEKIHEEIKQVYEILQKMVDRKNEGLDFNNVPFTLSYKYGNINKIDVVVEPTSFDEKVLSVILQQLNNFLPTFTWSYELHLEERFMTFVGNDKPPTMARWPGSWLRPLHAFPMGISGNGELIWQPDSANKKRLGRSLFLDEKGNPVKADMSLSKAPQGLCAGGTGGGKSVAIQNLIMHAIEHRDEISLALVDPKVVEFSNYKGMNGIVGVANTIQETCEMLRIGKAVMYKRNRELAKLGCKQVAEYTPHEFSGKVYMCGREYDKDQSVKVKDNGEEKTMTALELAESLEDMREVEVCLNDNDWITANRNCIHKIFSDAMPMLLFIVDEMAELTQKSGLKSEEAKQEDAMKDEIVSIISSIAQLGRSAAVHVLVATQKPNATVVPTILRSNLGLRVFMGVAAEAGASLVTLDNTLATTTDGTYPGMGIMQVNAQPVFFRSYFSKFEDLEDYYQKRGMDSMGYGPENQPNGQVISSDNIDLEGDEEFDLPEEQVNYEFESIHKTIDKRQDQKWEEI